MKMQPDMAVLKILENDHAKGLHPPERLWREYDSNASRLYQFRSPYETLLWAYSENHQNDQIEAMCDDLHDELDGESWLPTCDLVAGWAMLQDDRAKTMLGVRAGRVMTIAPKTPYTSVTFGDALLSLLWAYWVFQESRLLEGARGLLSQARETLKRKPDGPYRTFMPAHNGTESVHGIAVALYALMVGQRTDPAYRVDYKQATAALARLIMQPDIIDWTHGPVTIYDAHGPVLLGHVRSWYPSENGASLIGAALGVAHPLDPCLALGRQAYAALIQQRDPNGKLALSDQSLLLFGSFHESAATFGAAREEP